MRNPKYYFPEIKPRRIKKFSRIRSTAHYLPEQIISNQDIIDTNSLPFTDKAMKKTLGVDKRRIAPEGCADSDLLSKAALACIKEAGIGPDDISRIMVTKFFGDRALPMTASLVQRKIGCKRTIQSFDVDGGINSFLQAVDIARHFINTGTGNVLINSGGLIRCLINQKDPRITFLFGDGAASLLLEPSDTPHILALYLYSNYEYYYNAYSYGEEFMKMKELHEKRDYAFVNNLYIMGNWKDSVDFYLEAAEVTRDRLLEESGLTMDDIDMVLVTENNKKIWSMTLERLGVPEEKSISLIEEYGNTMSAMLPLLLDKGFKDGLFKEGMHIMLISHGEGANGGGLIYKI